ncbi:S-adenosyl-L-methionine-dependent methyltransferase [Naematelia encephala]|uniref:S-adenosyl-L-methionine-dependent methyltransferase n=1 Tax=Naematelia encephala TaxID=71784 RepID=A0A1Y2AWZ1_9TREE|nr:S-adenosyl-L-methionine-dependent methyltransferase [Naematelia encephala]
MGKHGRGGRRQGKDRSGPTKPTNRPDNDTVTGPWKTFTAEDMVNVGFEEYYKSQNIMTEDEWPAFLAACREELPTTFRVTGSRAHAETINDLIKTKYVPTMQNVEWEGVKYDPPTQMEWYPDSLAWQISAPKRVVRKTAPFKAFQKFLVGETEVGNLSRQEAVSMIPPLLLDVHPHHLCLDMCAAPGSKTAQIIEALNPHDGESTGLLIANDSDYKRTHMLVHQTGRMPSRGLMVTNLDASAIPNISLGNGKVLTFDRILADVPCSGDGTLRKNPGVWKSWGPMDANGLHSLQLRILERGMNLLKPGGRLVYSTCSFNPIENEAVVAAALNSHEGKFKIIDASTRLPDLKRRPGLTSWKVATQPESTGRTLKYHETYETYRAWVDEGNEREKDKMRGLAKTLWAPDNVTELGLEKCLRLLPHDQNTGGFFVCVLEKAGSPSTTSNKADLVQIEEILEIAAPASEVPEPEPAPTLPADVTVADESGTATLKRAVSPSVPAGPEAKKPMKKKEKPDLGFREDPYSFVDRNNAEVQSCVGWFKLNDSFPVNNLLVRNAYGDPVRSLYMVNDIIKSIVLHNDYSRLRIISAGVKGFTRQDSQTRTDLQCKWRIPMDGLLEVVPHIPDDVIRDATLAELKVFIEEQYPPVTKFSEDAQTWLTDAKLGNLVVRFSPGDDAGGHLSLPLLLPVWKAKTSLSLLIDKREKVMLSERVFGVDLTPVPQATLKEKAQGKEVEVSEEVKADLEEEALNQ